MIMGLRWGPIGQAEQKGVYYCYICDIIHFRSCFRRLPRESPLTEPPVRCYSTSPLPVPNASSTESFSVWEMLCERCSCQDVLSIARSMKPPPPPAPELFRTNCAPSDTQANAIRDSLTSLRSSAELQKLDDNIEHLQGVLEELKRKQSELRAFFQENEPLISAQRRLPPELWMQIFMYCLPDDAHVVQDHTHAPLLITNVCSYWRTIALSTPRLWSSLYVCMTHGQEYTPILQAVVEAWLHRSKIGALDIIIEIFRNPWVHGMTHPDPTPLIDTLLPDCHRWRNFNIQAKLSTMTQLAVARNRLPCLESLEIDIWEGIVTEVCDAFEIAPRLRTLCLRYGVDTYMVKIPWGQLTECRLLGKYFPFDQCFGVLEQCPQLMICQLYIAGPLSEDFKTDSPILLNHLHTLQIHANPSVPQLFDNIVLPVLVNFGFESSAPNLVSHPQFMTLLSRSSSSLEKLSLNLNVSSSPSGDELIDYMKLCPSLTHLALGAGSSCSLISERVWELLTCHQGLPDGCLSPRLESFKFWWPWQGDHTGGEVLDMIMSRKIHGRYPIRVGFRFHKDGREQDASAMIRHLKREGLWEDVENDNLPPENILDVEYNVL